MKKLFMTAVFLLIGTNAFAREPKATLCRDKAVTGATAMFYVNNTVKGKLSFSTELVDLDHSEGGAEVWDVKFKVNNLNYSPYRMTVIIDDCIITGFSMPFAG